MESRKETSSQQDGEGNSGCWLRARLKINWSGLEQEQERELQKNESVIGSFQNDSK